MASNELKKYCGNYLISLGSVEFVKLINGEKEEYIKKWMLQAILVHANQPLIDEVFGALEPSNYLLRSVASSTELACMPQRFTYLLGKINSKDGQEEAVEHGVFALVMETGMNVLILFSLHLAKGHF